MNLIYIRAAIEAHTGIKLKLEQARQYLIEEGLATAKQIDATVFNGYKTFYPRTKENKTNITKDMYEEVINSNL